MSDCAVFRVDDPFISSKCLKISVNDLVLKSVLCDNTLAKPSSLTQAFTFSLSLFKLSLVKGIMLVWKSLCICLNV